MFIVADLVSLNCVAKLFMPQIHFFLRLLGKGNTAANTVVQLNLCKTATLKKTENCVFNTNFRLMQVKRIAECSKGSILQYF